MSYRYTHVIILTIVSLLSVAPQLAHALSATPAIINFEGIPKDKIERTVLLRNDTTTKVNVYAFVQDIDKTTGAQTPIAQTPTNLPRSLASWIEVTRAVIELSPGEAREIPIEVLINLRAVADYYHALVSFVPGSTRTDALNRLSQGTTVLFNARVDADITESVQIKKFGPERSVALGAATLFALDVENIGNVGVVPVGNIHITNRRGQEVAVLPFNNEAQVVEAGETHAFAVPWEGGAGRYKAFLELHYGVASAGLTDTAFVTMVPWPFVAVGGVVLVLFLVWRMMSRKDDDDDYEYFEDDAYEDEYDDDDELFEREYVRKLPTVKVGGASSADGRGIRIQ